MALISGTARGQGRAAALRFAAEGALVVGGDLPHEEAVETQRLIAREGGTALSPSLLDVTDEDSVRAWTEEAVDAFGGIDIVHADAGAVRFGAIDGRSSDGSPKIVRECTLPLTGERRAHRRSPRQDAHSLPLACSSSRRSP
ncbi:SDR family oxidoreductase [Streptomyces flaveolus]|uniref:SDR family oxidoreductase n=1 Tax=Streptomyces flaveolus TaxID=67297 RepID=UPI001987EFFF|nr:SDR family oxidoreductase [Streptomyces flaveolus]GGQ97272.1 hypothetical protein GCM10010216_69580 [Streptomyces flaveolus]